MKKIKGIIFLLFVFFIFEKNVYANDMLLCRWKINVESYDDIKDGTAPKNGTAKVELYFQKDGNFRIRFDNDCGGDVWSCKGSKDKIISSTGLKNSATVKDGVGGVYFSNNAYSSLFNDGNCPSEAYYDIYSAHAGRWGTDEVCIGERRFCETKDNNSTRFSQVDFDWGSRDIKFVSSSVSSNNIVGLAAQMNNAAKAALSSYKVDKTKSYDDNTICKRLSGQTLQKELNEKAIAASKKFLNTGDYNISDANALDFMYDLLVKNLETVGDAFGIETINNQVLTDCSELLKKSNKSEEEKEKEQNKLDEGHSVIEDALTDYLKDYMTFKVNKKFDGNESCEGFLGDPTNHKTPAYFLKLIMNIFKYAAIILSLVLSIVDFFKAIFSQDKELLQKATKSSAKRLVFAVIIFFLPIVINFFLSLIGAYSSCV